MSTFKVCQRHYVQHDANVSRMSCIVRKGGMPMFVFVSANSMLGHSNGTSTQFDQHNLKEAKYKLTKMARHCRKCSPLKIAIYKGIIDPVFPLCVCVCACARTPLVFFVVVYRMCYIDRNISLCNAIPHMSWRVANLVVV